MLKWARSEGCPWDKYVCTYAAKNGYLEILKYARSEGCPWDENVCSYAALNGHIEILKWARSEGCPWNYLTCSFAVRNGHMEILEWARSEGCQWDVETCSYVLTLKRERNVVMIQKLFRMYLAQKKANILRCIPENLFDNEFGKKRRQQLINEELWN